MKVVNNHTQPVTLESGEVIGVGARVEVENLSDGDRRRLLDRGRIAIVEPPPQGPSADAAQDTSKAPTRGGQK